MDRPDLSAHSPAGRSAQGQPALQPETSADHTQAGPPWQGFLPTQRRSRRDGRYAQLHDEAILPLWTERFGRPLLFAARAALREAQQGVRHDVLEVLCGTGYVTEQLLLRRRDYPSESLRVVAIDSAPSLLDVARRRLGSAAGKKVYFRSDPAEPKLPFDSDVFDLVVCNLGLPEVAAPRTLLSEMARVARPGAQVICTLPLRGTFFEFYVLLERMLSGKRFSDAISRLRSHLAATPSVVEAKSWLAEAGLEDPRVDAETHDFELLFGSGREFFYSPLIESVLLPHVRDILTGISPQVSPTADSAQLEDGVQRVCFALKEAIDESCQPPGVWPYVPFVVTVKVGTLCGRKPLSLPPPPASGEAEVVLSTGEIDILEMMPKDPRG